MKKDHVVSLAFLLPLAAVLVGCVGHVITTADFVGTWTATTWTETNLASPDQKVDVIALGGGWTITIASDGSYTGTVVLPGPVTVPVSGTSTILSNSSMVVQQGASTFNITYTLSGNTWTLTHTDGTYDFSGSAVPSRQEITAIRS